MHSNFPEPIAIVGSGCRFPGGASSPSSLWKLLEKPRDVSTEIPDDRFELKGYYHPKGAHHGTTNVQRAYMLQEDFRKFDTGFFNISPNEAESMGNYLPELWPRTCFFASSKELRMRALPDSDCFENSLF